MENAAGSTPDSRGWWWVVAMPAAHTFIAPRVKPVPASARNSRTRAVFISRPLPAAPLSGAAGRQVRDGAAVSTTTVPARPSTAVTASAASGSYVVASQEASRGPAM